MARVQVRHRETHVSADLRVDDETGEVTVVAGSTNVTRDLTLAMRVATSTVHGGAPAWLPVVEWLRRWSESNECELRVLEAPPIESDPGVIY